ncbi:type II secretion system protein GspL [Oceanospirillum sediminis]|uniref:GspL cytoplasmic actin-ATPase-like domain-containing protein n=1 Tax=Oceanospirillum sediminis TaxID=2760088 RepID=A0A839IMW5_9GAMM|nr:type II secretion system protein GspL [Oceanospirillum sediminis]MBB1485852.1 hypothetical protein [Oceanospirillum sediminis]
MNAAVILSLQLDSEKPLSWLLVDDGHEGFSSDLDGFKDWLSDQKQVMSLYVLLPANAVSFHHVDIPAGVRRSANQLIPVLIEEQLAQDADQVFVHFNGRIVDEPVDNRKPDVNTVVCDKQWYELLKESLKSPKLKWQACVPVQICRFQQSERQRVKHLPLPAPHDEDVLIWPEDAVATEADFQKLLSELRLSSWNMIRPDKVSIGAGFDIVVMLIAVAGLYLLNLWLG